MNRFLPCLFLPLAFAQPAMADECPMQPVPIDVTRIARDPAVQSHVVDKKKLTMSVLLKNGRSFRLVQMGCAHSGGSATLWLDSDLSVSDAKAWTKEIEAFARLALAPEVARDILGSLKRGGVRTEETETGIVMHGSVDGYMTYSISISGADEGVLLGIMYSIG